VKLARRIASGLPIPTLRKLPAKGSEFTRELQNRVASFEILPNEYLDYMNGTSAASDVVNSMSDFSEVYETMSNQFDSVFQFHPEVQELVGKAFRAFNLYGTSVLAKSEGKPVKEELLRLRKMQAINLANRALVRGEALHSPLGLQQRTLHLYMQSYLDVAESPELSNAFRSQSS
jgi:hypothetical protein